LKILKNNWNGIESTSLADHFVANPTHRNEVVKAVQAASSGQGSRTYDELNAIEFALRKQGKVKLMKKLGIRVAPRNIIPTKEFNYISMPSPKKKDKSDRQAKCHRFHQYTNNLILSLSAKGKEAARRGGRKARRARKHK